MYTIRNMDFDSYYKKLNKAQKEAVDTIEGPVMVVAGPGTGKTQILTLRIANILKKTQVDPENILALTFTEAGAKEMRRRLRLIAGPAADRVRLHTYHGFAGSIISEFDDHFPHLARARQITEIEAESIVREILKDKKFYKLRPSGDPDLYIAKIISAISDSKQEAWMPEMVRSFARDEINRVSTDEQWLSTRGPTKGKVKAEGLKRIEKCERTLLFADVYEVYEAKKISERLMDYDDLILELISTLRKDELLLRLLQEKFQYILVDEHQDTNDAQNTLIRLIAEFFESPNLFVVGDEKQAIYRFQGASVENFMSFQKKWSGIKIIRLEQNYRSQQNILDASFAMIENNYSEGLYPELRVRLQSEAEEESRPIDIVTAGNNIASDEYLISQIKEVIKNHPKQVSAVIVRRNSDVQSALALLEENNIPAMAERGSDIFLDPLGIIFFSLIEFLADPSKTESLARCLACGLWDFDIDQRVNLIKSLRSGRVSNIDNEIPGLVYLRKEMIHSGAVAYLILVGDESGITDIARRDSGASQIWRGIISLSQELARQNPDSAADLIRALLNYRQSAGTRKIKIVVGPPDALVRVMTAHGSKGLEFDNVFLPYAVEESWLPRGRGEYFILPRQDEEADLADERRLFYVALTRARSRAYIISPLEEGPRKLTPLRFIEELDSTQIARTELPSSIKKLQENRVLRPEFKRKSEAVEYAKRTLAGYGLSVTALNHFCECPLKFFYKSILRLPEPPTASSEKGNAMHEAIANVWHLETKTEKTIAETISQSVRKYMESSLLPSYDKEPALESLLEDAPVVASALLAHFQEKGTISTETRREATFNSQLLHGKLDAVIESANSILVFDYKTREAMSVNAIKGNTKDADGNYFRQLVFYKLLLMDDKQARKKIEPALVFVKPDSKGRCPVVSLPIEEGDLSKVKEEIRMLIESVESGSFLESSCEQKDCEYCVLNRAFQKEPLS
ncbi:MAG: hypothetical protein A3C88_00880 [Candidatus Yanofskybacteria bacterium RIFCSPHIGHO2_02_FULL_50_12]|uniref:DNA 3'-5' helicase n=1 Tax=Candidatus Yanofskybacteria bacterium RIFCSPHIGHO2_02_FULL_50_12 TaxID=1802685 RepID=A0A1F8FUD7_9BACT|nr:MAG: hypothetical protein A3C88_00880 [Candidatus Yanofskybacteria bacterium RIFCSPHIGHO2_02_FULL_50_12]